MRIHLLLVASLASGCGITHLQRDGRYELSYDPQVVPGGVLRDECELGQAVGLPGTVELWVTGDAVRLEFSVFELELLGFYRSGVERFYADGTATQRKTTVRGAPCNSDVAARLEGRTDDAEHFAGTVSVLLDTTGRAGCRCEVALAYSAAKLANPE